MARSKKTAQQFVVLPTRGLRATPSTSSSELIPFLTALTTVRTAATARSFVSDAGLEMASNFKVLDSIREDGAKLVEMTTDTAKDLQASQPGLRIVPVVYYEPAVIRYAVETRVAARTTTAAKTEVTVTSARADKPVRGATVVAFTDFERRMGAQGVTNAQGIVRLPLARAATVERLYVYPKHSFWGTLRKNVSTRGGIEVRLTPVTLDFTDALRHYYGNAPDGAGQGVTVGIVDTGVGPHPDLVVAGGLNCVTGENPEDFGDNGEGHGSHVGGIVAARGTPPRGIRGIAPGSTLRSYRVFGKGAK